MSTTRSLGYHDTPEAFFLAYTLPLGPCRKNACLACRKKEDVAIQTAALNYACEYHDTRTVLAEKIFVYFFAEKKNCGDKLCRFAL
jgi:hypothetical protein